MRLQAAGISLVTLLALIAASGAQSQGNAVQAANADDCRVNAYENRLPGDPPLSPIAAACRSFVAFQWATLQESGTDLERISAVAAAGNGDLKRLEDNRRALISDLRSEEQIERALRLEGKFEEADSRLRTIDNKRAMLTSTDNTIAQQFPNYLDLARPSALSVNDLQARLKANEALVAFLATEKGTFVWAITQSGIEWRRITHLTKTEVELRIVALRNDIDRPTGDFDRALAQQMYRELFGPVSSSMRSVERLIIVPTGPFASLPFAVLDSAARPRDTAAWMSDRFALTTLPGVSAIRLYRCRTGDSGCRKPSQPGTFVPRADSVDFVGIGAPALQGEPLVVGRGQRLTSTLNIAPLLSNSPDRALLLQQRRLPFADQELQEIARAFGQRGRVLRGSQATEVAAKSLPEVRAASFISFATHGVTAGSSSRLTEPGLILTPPATATPGDDGYLAASEIAALRINARLVALSACNTLVAGQDAGTRRPDGVGLASLNNAFLFAGARGVLASHWQVSDESTARLMTDVFQRLKANPQLNGADALRQSMASLRRDPRFQHPYFWAAFSYGGDPG
jgi:CHAT domain-containing protein